MDRREFLKMAGLGTTAMASIPLLGNVALATDSPTGWRFTALSHLGSDDVVGLTGSGLVTPSSVVGEGSLVHWRPLGAPPFPIVSTGTWKAGELVDFSTIGTYGSFAAGIVEMRINLVLSTRLPEAATLKMVCNLGPAGLLTGLPEGVFLTVAGGTFEPFVPPLGLTVFTIENEKRNLA